MKYTLAKELKDAGFPQPFLDKNGVANGHGWIYPGDPYAEGMESKGVYLPSLEELVEACGNGFVGLDRIDDGWQAAGFPTTGRLTEGRGKTPLEAVAKLWLCLQRDSIKDNGKPKEERDSGMS